MLLNNLLNIIVMDMNFVYVHNVVNMQISILINKFIIVMIVKVNLKL